MTHLKHDHPALGLARGSIADLAHHNYADQRNAIATILAGSPDEEERQNACHLLVTIPEPGRAADAPQGDRTAAHKAEPCKGAVT